MNRANPANQQLNRVIPVGRHDGSRCADSILQQREAHNGVFFDAGGWNPQRGFRHGDVAPGAVWLLNRANPANQQLNRVIPVGRHDGSRCADSILQQAEGHNGVIFVPEDGTPNGVSVIAMLRLARFGY
nr:hypothetical protein [Pseudomonas marincola]